MRIMPSRYISQAKPIRIKKTVLGLQHIQAPLKGLSISSELTTKDPLLAPVLDNYIVEEDRISCRPGHARVLTHADAKPIVCLVPFYGDPGRLAAATNGKLANISTGATIKDGFLSDDWHWTSFSNLSDTDFTVMVNGVDGVWSWDGTDAAGGMVKETVTVPASKPYIVPDQFQIVVSHMNRLWFADSSTLALYYLPLQQKTGEVKELPLNAIFKRGGSIRAVYTWTIDGGMGLDDQLVIFSTNGEAAIYNGVDPDTDFTLTGVYRFDSPMSKHSVVNYGGELYALISTGLVPMSTLMRSESENLGKAEKGVVTKFTELANTMRDRPGWMVLLDHGTGRILCNQPLGSLDQYRQMIRFMPNPIWASWSALPSRCWGWIDNRLFFGSDNGRVYEMSPVYLNDDSQPIKLDVQAGWSSFRTPAQKQFKMIRAYVITDGDPRPYLDMRVDYDTSAPFNQPDVTEAGLGAEWDDADWDTADWAGASRAKTGWNGVSAKGGVGGPRMVVLIKNCTFSVTGWDVTYEPGSVL